jgi:CBS domain-containing protein
MDLNEILAEKGKRVYSISPDATLREASKKLLQHRVGALLVFERGADATRADQLLGIISERDLIRLYAEAGSLENARVAEVMSTHLILGSPRDAVEEVMGLMTRERKRHLPVVDEGRVLGIVSIGDIVKAQHDRLAVENRFMKDYIRS